MFCMNGLRFKSTVINTLYFWGLLPLINIHYYFTLLTLDNATFDYRNNKVKLFI